MRSKIPAQRLQLLRSVAPFRGLNDHELARVDGLMDDVEIAQGRVLVREGGISQEAFVVIDGQAEVTIAGRRIALVGPGELIGEMSVIDAAPRNATVTALTAMRVFAVHPSRFHALLDDPSVRGNVMAGLVRRLRQADTSPVNAAP